jgi:hypothetical protein
VRSKEFRDRIRFELVVGRLGTVAKGFDSAIQRKIIVEGDWANGFPCSIVLQHLIYTGDGKLFQ